MKKHLSLPSVLVITLLSVLIAVLVTAQCCYRYMYLSTKEEYSRLAAEITQKYTGGEPDIASAFEELYDSFKAHYDGTLDEETLKTELLKTFISLTGDRYAEYYTAEEYQELLAQYSGSDKAFGIRVTRTTNDGIIVYYVEKNSPAADAGIKKGDEIVAVEGQRISEIGYTAGCALLTAEPEKECLVTVLKDGIEHEYSLTRKEITVSSIQYSMEANNVGYIRIFSFGEKTFEEFKTAVDTLTREGATALVFDVRNNGGGLLSAVRSMLDYLLPDGTEESPTLIVSTTDNKKNVQNYYCSDEHQVDIPMAVLINEQTASAAELFAAALRDHEVAVLVGMQTYGKGVAQSTYTFKDGTAFKLTTAHYAPPSGINYDGIGVLPDVNASTEGINIYLLEPADDPVFKAAVESIQK